MSAQPPAPPITGWLFDLRPLRGPAMTVADDEARARQRLLDYLRAVAITGSPSDAEAMLDEIDAEISAVLLP